MKEKWRKSITIFLSCIILSLNFAVEFAHYHAYFQQDPSNLSNLDSQQNFSNNSQFHSLVCVACLFSLSQLAPNLSIQTFKPNLSSNYSYITQTAVYFTSSNIPYSLRAPPAS